jgi:hypothetical protein
LYDKELLAANRLLQLILPNGRKEAKMKHLVAFLIILISTAAYAAKFDPGCKLPFDDIAVQHGIDESCAKEGTPQDPQSAAQDIVKNNLCITGSPVSIVTDDLVKLQDAVSQKGVHFGRGHLPKDRGALTDLVDASGTKIGEGKIVSLVGYIVDAHYADVESGESVNCNTPGKENNDIHFNVSPTPVTLPKVRKEATPLLCKMGTAEILPHFRPKAWELPTLLDLEKNNRPVRITGQLFFDGSHKPCVNGVPTPGGNPARVSLWEIHPVYSLEVCSETDITKCGHGSWKRLAAATVATPSNGKRLPATPSGK